MFRPLVPTPRHFGATLGLVSAGLGLLLPSPALGDGGVTFHELSDPGLIYARPRSPEFAAIEAFEEASLETPLAPPAFIPVKPEMTGGYPGVAILDYDGDGDLDLYVTNGPGAANSLFASRLAETGSLSFVDEAAAAGVESTDQDSSGVCYGDLDNDGDPDLLVMGRHAPNRLFENHGDGTFTEVLGSGIEAGLLWSTSCAVGDVDGDGLLDVLVANTADTSDGSWIYTVPFALNEHNQLFRNLGGLAFEDVSAASGIEALAGFPPGFEGSASITWAVGMADVDLDGDLDIVHADDQGGFPVSAAGGLDRGFVHVLLNDGTGSFTDHPIGGPLRVGTWMGVAFGDLDCDGAMDLHVTNFGDYSAASLGAPTPLGLIATRWFLGAGDGTFADPGTGSLGATAFGWGNAIFDYDNDGDLDILSHGGLDASFEVTADNPGLVHRNEGCSASFTYDFEALPEDPTCLDPLGQQVPGCTRHIRRNVRGVAVGDLDGNGFTDVVTAANVTNPAPLPLVPSPASHGSPLDTTAFFVPIFGLTPQGFVWTGLNSSPGDLVVELAAGNGNRWAAVRVQGSVGLTSGGRVNRDGVGAVLSFRPYREKETMVPVTGGSSHLSQHSPERIFGLGQRRVGRLEVLWPGGVRNRLYGVRAGERLLIPEIPCGFDAGLPFHTYLSCVAGALKDLRQEGVVDEHLQLRLLLSALIAYEKG